MDPSDIPAHYDTTLDKIAKYYSVKLSTRYYVNHLYGYLPANGERGGPDYKQMQVSPKLVPNSREIPQVPNTTINFWEKHVNVGRDTDGGVIGGYEPKVRIPYSDPNFEQRLYEAIDKELSCGQS